MRAFLRTTVVVLGAAWALASGPVARALEVGEAAPRLALRGADAAVEVPAANGKLTYVDFWASWCGTCRQSFPWMNALQHKYGAAGLTVVGVNLDAEAADAATFLARVPAEFTVAYDPDGDSARSFGVKGMPTSLLIAADGTVLLRHTGFSAEDGEAIEAAIRDALESAR